MGASVAPKSTVPNVNCWMPPPEPIPWYLISVPVSIYMNSPIHSRYSGSGKVAPAPLKPTFLPSLPEPPAEGRSPESPQPVASKAARTTNRKAIKPTTTTLRLTPNVVIILPSSTYPPPTEKLLASSNTATQQKLTPGPDFGVNIT